ncbi:hypothetical protein FB451DRAFT_1403186 [Mycena latifolia]|nr:hypothetical protein FB451DRAFT_1403186 [Mycena latifolia]
MKFTTPFKLFALLPLVSAFPMPDPAPPTLASRAQGSIYVCVNALFETPCAKFSGASGQCVNFPAAYKNDISSVGPDSGQDCFFFVGPGCTGASFGPLRNPGSPNLATLPPAPTTGFNDRLSSFK